MRQKKQNRSLSGRPDHFMKKPNIYKFTYTCEENVLRKKYFTCQNTDTAITQFNAGMEHKHQAPENIQVYECPHGGHAWTLVFSVSSFG